MRDLLNRAAMLAETHPWTDAVLSFIGAVALAFVVCFCAAAAIGGAP